MIITIDGPSLSGKSTVARALAKELDGYYIYSGLLFRAVAYLLKAYSGYDESNIHDITDRDLQMYLDSDRLEYVYNDSKGAHIFFDEVDITLKLHNEEIGNLASCVGKNKVVRNYLKNMQQELAQNKYIVIADGRDSGSVIFKNADVSFYLTATLEERSRRMQWAASKKGKSITIDEAKKQIKERDKRDSSREIAPLTKTSDMIEIDTTGKHKNETIKEILYRIEAT